MAVEKTDFRSWLARIIAWDGLFPAAMVLIPMAIDLIAPPNKIIQTVVFSIAILLLVFFDCLIVALHFWGGFPPSTGKHWLDLARLFACFFAIYVPLMAIAMYPGPAR